MLFVRSFLRSFVRSCHGSAGREAGRTARPRTTEHDRPRTTTHDRPRTTAHDRPRTTAHDRPRTHDRARPRTTDRARPRTTTHYHARPRMTDHARPTTPDHGCHICLRKRYPPHPRGFRGLNCLARLALAGERTPSILELRPILPAVTPLALLALWLAFPTVTPTLLLHPSDQWQRSACAARERRLAACNAGLACGV